MSRAGRAKDVHRFCKCTMETLAIFGLNGVGCAPGYFLAMFSIPPSNIQLDWIVLQYYCSKKTN